MNIFILADSFSPIESASLHCDQHLHKMILESAQMVSTAFHLRELPQASAFYSLAYPKHPCTRWVAASNHHILWLCEMGLELERIRTEELDHPFHASAPLLRLARDIIQEDFPYSASRHSSDFVFAGPAHIKLNNSLSIPEKYRKFYRIKHQDWLDRGLQMSYKGRSLPRFLQDLSFPQGSFLQAS